MTKNKHVAHLQFTHQMCHHSSICCTCCAIFFPSLLWFLELRALVIFQTGTKLPYPGPAADDGGLPVLQLCLSLWGEKKQKPYRALSSAPDFAISHVEDLVSCFWENNEVQSRPLKMCSPLYKQWMKWRNGVIVWPSIYSPLSGVLFSVSFGFVTHRTESRQLKLKQSLRKTKFLSCFLSRLCCWWPKRQKVPSSVAHPDFPGLVRLDINSRDLDSAMISWMEAGTASTL